MSCIVSQVEQLLCWHNCDRRQATQLLLTGACRPGTYLVRPCHSRSEKYAITVLQERRRSLLLFWRSQPAVRNYLIKERDGGYYIFGDQWFSEVQHLVAHYSRPRRRMRTPLRYPFPRATGPAPGSSSSSSSGRLSFQQKLVTGSYEVFSANLNGRQVISLVLDGGTHFETAAGTGGGAAAAAAAAKESEDEPDKPPLPPRPELHKLTMSSLTLDTVSKGQQVHGNVYDLQDPEADEALMKPEAAEARRGDETSRLRSGLNRCSQMAVVTLRALFK